MVGFKGKGREPTPGEQPFGVSSPPPVGERELVPDVFESGEIGTRGVGILEPRSGLRSRERVATPAAPAKPEATEVTVLLRLVREDTCLGFAGPFAMRPFPIVEGYDSGTVIIG